MVLPQALTEPALPEPELRQQGLHRPGLRELAGRARPVSLARERVLPVLPAFCDLLPDGGLRRGMTMTITGESHAGLTSMALALVAASSAAGSWCAAVGMPALGALAAAELGFDLSRFALVPAAGPQWATVAAALLDALDVVIVQPPLRVRSADARRLSARLRERGSVLLVMETGGRAGWPEPPGVRVSVREARWEGLGQGHGRLEALRVEMAVDGKGTASRQRRARLWLPAPSGGVERE